MPKLPIPRPRKVFDTMTAGEGGVASSGLLYTDSHAHLPGVAERLGQEALATILGAFASAGEGKLLVDIGTEAADFPGRLALLGHGSFLRYSLGVWPGAEALADPQASLAALTASLDLAGNDAAAIGECGLDYYHMEGSREAQLALFDGQARLAVERGLPLIVHSRDAFEDTAGFLGGLGLPSDRGMPVIIHCFGYGPGEAERFLELGCHVSFAGNLTYRKADRLREALRLVPDDRLLLETDSPYMNPEPGRGKPASPLDIGRTYALAASLRNVDTASLAALVDANAAAIFGCDPSRSVRSGLALR